jgi:hypothetical protein
MHDIATHPPHFACYRLREAGFSLSSLTNENEMSYLHQMDFEPRHNRNSSQSMHADAEHPAQL